MRNSSLTILNLEAKIDRCQDHVALVLSLRHTTVHGRLGEKAQPMDLAFVSTPESQGGVGLHNRCVEAVRQGTCRECSVPPWYRQYCIADVSPLAWLENCKVYIHVS